MYLTHAQVPVRKKISRNQKDLLKDVCDTDRD